MFLKFLTSTMSRFLKPVLLVGMLVFLLNYIHSDKESKPVAKFRKLETLDYPVERDTSYPSLDSFVSVNQSVGKSLELQTTQVVQAASPTYVELVPVVQNWVLIGQISRDVAISLCNSQQRTDATGAYSTVSFLGGNDKKTTLTAKIQPVSDCLFSNGVISRGTVNNFNYATVCEAKSTAATGTPSYCQVFDTSPVTNLYPRPAALGSIQSLSHGILETDNDVDGIPEEGGSIVKPDVSAACCSGSLTYYGGRLISGVNIIPIYWNSACQYIANFNTFYTDVMTTSFLGFLGEYTTNGYSIGIAGSRGTPYTDNQVVVASTAITHAMIVTRLNTLITNGNVAAPANNRIYSIHFPPNAVITPTTVPGVTGSSCSGWCGYHYSYMRNGQRVYYQVIADNSTPNCRCGSGLAGMTSVVSHEIIEAITDPDVNAGTLGWYDSTDNGEIGDLCNWQTAVATYNGRSYTVQKEWSNYYKTCVVPGPTAAPSPSPSPSCFSGDSKIQVLQKHARSAVDDVNDNEDDEVRVVTIDQVRVGDKVLSADAYGTLKYSDVVVVPHKVNAELAEFVRIVTSNGREIKLTPGHFIAAGECTVLSGEATIDPIRASDVEEGFCLHTVSGIELVQSSDRVLGRGVYTLIPMEEFIVVDGVIASPYAVPHKLSHHVFDAYRLLYQVAPDLMKSSWFLECNEGLLSFLGRVSFPVLNGDNLFRLLLTNTASGTPMGGAEL